MSSQYFGAVNLLGGQSSQFTNGLPLDITDPLILGSVPTSSVIISGSDGTLSGVSYGSGSNANSIVQRDSSGNITINKATMLSLSNSTVLVSDGSKAVVSSSTPSSKLAYLNNVTSDIQAQINGITPGLAGVTDSSGIVTFTSNLSTVYIQPELVLEGETVIHGLTIIEGNMTFSPSSDGNALSIYNSNSSSTILQANTSSGIVTVSGLTNTGTSTLEGSVNITGTCSPTANTTYDLGTTSNYWNNAYINAVITPSLFSSTGTLYSGTSIVPTSTNSYNIGSTGNRWNNIYCNNVNYMSLVSGSDKRLKEDIQQSKYGIDFINKLSPKTYNYIADEKKTTRLGLVAQDVADILKGYPDLCNNAIVHTDQEGILGLNYVELITPLVLAVQQLSTEVERLRNQLNQLQS